MSHVLKAAAIATFVCVSSVVGAAQSAADRAAIEKTIAANESKINDAFAKVDIATMKSMIAPDAQVVEANGTMAVADFFAQMPTMNIKITEQRLSNFKYLWIDANTVVQSYTWTGKGTVGGTAVSTTYGSTVWSKRGTAWLAMFHQETPAPPPAAAGARSGR